MKAPLSGLITFGKRLGAGGCFALLSVLLCLFTLFDVLICFLARRRKTGLGARPFADAVWRLLSSPRRRAIWSVGFWVTALAFFAMLLRM